MRTASLTKEEAGTILSRGAFFTLDDYALRRELIDKITATFLEGIRKISGESCAEKVAADGLGQLHRHFPIEKIHLLEAHLMRELRDDLYYWSYRVGADTIGLTDPFYVDHLVVFRIHYPFLLARTAGRVERPPIPWRERARLAAAALRDWEMLGSYLKKRRDTAKSRKDGSVEHNPAAYFGDIPVPARSHGPHVDSWYGHSYEGINLWLSIDGVNEDNTVILYPEMFGRPMKFDPVSMYIAKGVELSKPHKVPLEPWQLLVFNPETLHGTQVNISDETRVALTTRINPAEPRFAPDAPFHMEHWYCSLDLQHRKYSVKLFPASKYQGKPSVVERERYEGKKTVRLRKDEKLGDEAPKVVCRADVLRQGEALAVDFSDARVLLWRDGQEVRAFSRICPHLGIDIADGFHDETQVFCPGHGIAFSLSDGHSKCESFTLRRLHAFEKDSVVYVERAVRASGTQ